MTRDELAHLIAQGEGQRLEFKRSLAELEDGVCTIAAFANAEGGTLLFGVRADGTVVGVTLGANTREQVVNAIVDNTDPPLYPQVEYLELEGRTIIAVSVAAGHDRPHLAYGRAYRRVGAVTAVTRLAAQSHDLSHEMHHEFWQDRALSLRHPLARESAPGLSIGRPSGRVAGVLARDSRSPRASTTEGHAQ